MLLLRQVPQMVMCVDQRHSLGCVVPAAVDRVHFGPSCVDASRPVYGDGADDQEQSGMIREYETARVEDRGDGLVLLTLNRPQVANAMNTQMGHDLLAFFDAVNADPLAHRCIVLTGAGDK